MNKPDILMFMTDQHTPYYSGFYGHNVDTPFLDYLAESGTCFDEAYTVAPICVPARASFVTAKRPAGTGVFDNYDPFSNITPTFMNYLVAEGYETVLVGRMHFIGPDQLHGFTRRIFPDCTTISYVRDDKKAVRGIYDSAYGSTKNTNVAGGGESSSAYYDQQVVNAALDYLSKPHEKPQFIVVSIYSPHHPYVGPKELYEKYRERVTLPETFSTHFEFPIWESMYRPEVSEELGKDIIAAYCAMVEHVDQQIKSVYEAFEKYCEGKNSEKLFVYFSDHGDHLGDRRAYGKTTFLEKSFKIPCIFCGDGVKKNNRIDGTVSIMDIGPTILDFIGCAPMKEVDGVSVASSLKGGEFNTHPVYAEMMYGKDGVYGFMLKYGRYKYITMSDGDKEALYDTLSDPNELNNLIDKLPQAAAYMRSMALENMAQGKAEETWQRTNWQRELWTAYDRATGSPYNDQYTFKGPVPEECRELPKISSENVTKY